MDFECFVDMPKSPLIKVYLILLTQFPSLTDKRQAKELDFKFSLRGLKNMRYSEYPVF